MRRPENGMAGAAAWIDNFSDLVVVRLSTVDDLGRTDSLSGVTLTRLHSPPPASRSNYDVRHAARDRHGIVALRPSSCHYGCVLSRVAHQALQRRERVRGLGGFSEGALGICKELGLCGSFAIEQSAIIRFKVRLLQTGYISPIQLYPIPTEIPKV